MKLVHTILQAILRSNEKFAIDLAGAQCRHHEAVIPWDKFQRIRIFDVIETKPAKLSKRLLHVNDYSPQAFVVYHMKTHELRVKFVIDHIIEDISMSAMEWQQKNISLEDLWKLPKDKFLTRQKNLVDFIEWGLNSYGDWNTVHGRELRARMKGKWVHNKG